MRSLVVLLPLLLLPSCIASSEAGELPDLLERRGTLKQPFTSGEAVSLDFELDGKVIAEAGAVADPRSLITAQLMYAIGHLNADRSVGRNGSVELSAITVEQRPTGAEISYHAKLPVAWGGPTTPSRYRFTLPARVARSDRSAFATKYGPTCVDPSAGVVDGERMFLFYRPERGGCVLDPNDVVTFEATTAPATEQTTAKYPEYHRIWDDRALDVVAMVSRANATPGAADEGIVAYDELVRRAREYLSSLQPDPAKRTEPLPALPADAATPRVKLGAVLDDGRRIGVDVMLVPYHLDEQGSGFDLWFDAVTPRADVILYNGHAALGGNVRALTEKGSFRSAKYVLWAVNGCDTFAYLDRTLADRRALLNPDDPRGTRYMDQVSNVMAGYFNTSPAFTMTFIDAAVTAAGPHATPRTYQQILAGIDPGQVVVVTGDEDNEFEPKALEPRLQPPPSAKEADTTPAPARPQRPPPSPETSVPPRGGSCAMGGAPAGGTSGLLLLAIAGLACRRRRTRAGLMDAR